MAMRWRKLGWASDLIPSNGPCWIPELRLGWGEHGVGEWADVSDQQRRQGLDSHLGEGSISKNLMEGNIFFTFLLFYVNPKHRLIHISQEFFEVGERIGTRNGDKRGERC